MSFWSSGCSSSVRHLVLLPPPSGKAGSDEALLVTRTPFHHSENSAAVGELQGKDTMGNNSVQGSGSALAHSCRSCWGREGLAAAAKPQRTAWWMIPAYRQMNAFCQYPSKLGGNRHSTLWNIVNSVLTELMHWVLYPLSVLATCLYGSVCDSQKQSPLQSILWWGGKGVGKHQDLLLTTLLVANGARGHEHDIRFSFIFTVFVCKIKGVCFLHCSPKNQFYAEILKIMQVQKILYSIWIDITYI